MSLRLNSYHLLLAPSHMPIGSLLHLAFPTFRALLLVPLLVALLLPRVVYTAIQNDGNVEVLSPTPSSFLLYPESNVQPSTGLSTVAGLSGDVSKYGTFRTTRSNLQRSAPATRAATPAPSTDPDPKVLATSLTFHAAFSLT
jgi:ATP-binding cassette subfamily B (MDR/TAP) protein 6